MNFSLVAFALGPMLLCLLLQSVWNVDRDGGVSSGGRGESRWGWYIGEGEG